MSAATVAVMLLAVAVAVVAVFTAELRCQGPVLRQLCCCSTSRRLLLLHLQVRAQHPPGCAHTHCVTFLCLDRSTLLSNAGRSRTAAQTAAWCQGLFSSSSSTSIALHSSNISSSRHAGMYNRAHGVHSAQARAAGLQQMRSHLSSSHSSSRQQPSQLLDWQANSSSRRRYRQKYKRWRRWLS